MAITSNQSAAPRQREHERAQQQVSRKQPSLQPEEQRVQDEDNNEQDPHGMQVTIGGVTYGAPVSFDRVPPNDFWGISTVALFFRSTVLAGTEEDFERLGNYAWDGQFYWAVDVESLDFRLWRDVIAVDDIYLSYYGSIHTKRFRNVIGVAKCMLSLAGAPLVEEDVDVDIWRYQYFGERPYVAKFCSVSAETLAAWRGRYAVDGDAICWHRAIIPARSRYEGRSESAYWTRQVKWDRRVLSALGQFVPYNLCCSYNLTETARDRLLVWILPRICRPRGFPRLLVRPRSDLYVQISHSHW